MAKQNLSDEEISFINNPEKFIGDVVANTFLKVLAIGTREAIKGIKNFHNNLSDTYANQTKNNRSKRLRGATKNNRFIEGVGKSKRKG